MAEIDYQDFDLSLDRAPEGFRATVRASPAGFASADFQLPFAPVKIENFILRLSRVRRGVRRVESAELQGAQEFGGALFQAVFSGEVRACLRSSLDDSRREGLGLRLRLRINDAELWGLPWEYLYYPTRNQFLALSVHSPLVRYIDLPEPIPVLAVAPPLRVLVMISSPTDHPTLDVDREWQILNDAVGTLHPARRVVLERLEEPSLSALQRALRRKEYHLFHFIGHGGYDRTRDEGVLLLEDEEQKGQVVSSHHFGMLLHDHRSLRVAVLNACEGARASTEDPFAGSAQTLVQRGLPAVIAMQFEIGDDVATTFAQEFYGALSDGYPVDAAVTESRKAIFASGHEVEWGTPVLYMRAPDGRIFDVQSEHTGIRGPAPVMAKASPIEHAGWVDAAQREAAAVLAIAHIEQYLERGALEDAEAALLDAQRAHPDRPELETLRPRIDEMRRGRHEDRERMAREVLDRAAQLVVGGHVVAAIEQLDAHSPPHAMVTAEADRLRAGLDTEADDTPAHDTPARQDITLQERLSDHRRADVDQHLANADTLETEPADEHDELTTLLDEAREQAAHGWHGDALRLVMQVLAQDPASAEARALKRQILQAMRAESPQPAPLPLPRIVRAVGRPLVAIATLAVLAVLAVSLAKWRPATRETPPPSERSAAQRQGRPLVATVPDARTPTAGPRKDERPTATPTPTAPLPGVLVLDLPPGTEVWIDATRQGRAPMASIDVANGSHDIVFRHPELGELRRPVTVAAGLTTRVAVSDDEIRSAHSATQERLARRALAQGNRERALSLVSAALRLNPAHLGLTDFMASLALQAMNQATDARKAAERSGRAARRSDAFELGDSHFERAEQSHKANRLSDAIPAYWAARVQYERAAAVK